MKIICPVCGAMLKLPETPGIENKNVKCPVCNNTNAFTKFRRIVENSTAPKPRPHAPNFDGAPANNVDDSATKVLDQTTFAKNQKKNKTPGVLRAGGMVFPLQMGKNIIGRQSSGQQATISLPCPDNKRMSRQHLLIEVKNNPDGSLSHVASLYKQQTNSTYINGQQLFFGNFIVLNDGAHITLPNYEIEFNL
ncbi:MAG: FHA domain-containing protein [Muribaculaceae bacterium]|nr:FHA domain-containing protein [Muribaculaceae bacterium]